MQVLTNLSTSSDSLLYKKIMVIDVSKIVYVMPSKLYYKKPSSAYPSGSVGVSMDTTLISLKNGEKIHIEEKMEEFMPEEIMDKINAYNVKNKLVGNK